MSPESETDCVVVVNPVVGVVDAVYGVEVPYSTCAFAFTSVIHEIVAPVAVDVAEIEEMTGPVAANAIPEVAKSAPASAVPTVPKMAVPCRTFPDDVPVCCFFMVMVYRFFYFY